MRMAGGNTSFVTCPAIGEPALLWSLIGGEAGDGWRWCNGSTCFWLLTQDSSNDDYIWAAVELILFFLLLLLIFASIYCFSYCGFLCAFTPTVVNTCFSYLRWYLCVVISFTVSVIVAVTAIYVLVVLHLG